MKNSFTKVGKLSLLLLTMFLTLSYFEDPPAARTGAPGEATCFLNCHNTPNAGFSGTSVNITGLPSSITPNTSYALSLTLTESSGSASVGGFESVALFNANNTNAGNWTVGANQSITSSGGRTYIRHVPAQSFAANEVVYDFSWTSPSAASGTVIKLYYAGVIADGDGNSSNDNVVTGSVTTTMSNPLPISGIALKGSTKHNANFLEWTVPTQQTQAPYQIEKSSDAINWIKISSIPSKNTTTTQAYSWIDHEAPTSSYYRIATSENGEKMNYSNIIYLKQASNIIGIYPNPVASTIYLNNAVDLLNCTIFDAYGKMVLQQVENSDNRIDVSTLKPGVYYLKLKSQKDDFLEKFVKI